MANSFLKDHFQRIFVFDFHNVLQFYPRPPYLFRIISFSKGYDCRNNISQVNGIVSCFIF